MRNNNKINFSDISINLMSGRFVRDWYRTPTSLGRYLNHYSRHSICHKKDIIVSLMDRAFRLSHRQFHEKNLNLIINILLDNDHLLDFIFTTICNWIKSLIYRNGNSPSLTRSPPSFFTIF